MTSHDDTRLQDGEPNTPCFGRRICPGSNNNQTRGMCRHCIPCVDEFIALEIERGRRLKTLMSTVRRAWPLASDYNILVKIAIVSKRVGKVWGYRAVRTAISASLELRSGGEAEAFMRNELRRRFMRPDGPMEPESRSEHCDEQNDSPQAEGEVVEGEEISIQAGTSSEGPVC